MLRTIQGKLLIPILAVVMVSGLGMGLASYKVASTAINEAGRSDGLRSVHALRQLVELVMDTARFDISGIASNPSLKLLLSGAEKNDGHLETLQEQMRELVTRQPLYNSLIVLNKDGIITASTSGSNGGKRGDREYFKASMTGKFYISPPSTSKQTSKTVIFISVPVYGSATSGSIVGVVMASVQVEPLNAQYIEPVRMLETGYAMLINDEGKYIGHKDEKMIATDGMAPELLRQFKNLPPEAVMQEGEINGERVLFFTEASSSTGWRPIIVCPRAEFYREDNRMAMVNSAFALALILLVACITFFAVRGVTKDLVRSTLFASSVAGGDLSSTLDIQRNDELGVLANALTTMVNKLKNMIAEAEQKSREAQEQSAKAREAMVEANMAKEKAETSEQAILVAAEQVDHVVNRLSAATEQLSAQLVQSSRSTDMQRDQLAQSATAMEEMNSTVLEVAKNAGVAAEGSDRAKDKAGQGAQVVQESVRSINEVQTETETLRKKMEELGHQAEAIGTIMTVISDIADQTNLLALNAAIEAARAGEAGRGFAVVADEVRKLAEKTMQATTEVGSAVGGIQTGTRQSITAVEHTVENLSATTALVQKSGEALDEIVAEVTSTAFQVSSIAAAAEQQSAASEEISHSLDEINRMADEGANAMQQSAQAVSELAQQTQELQTLVAELRKRDSQETA